MLVLTADDRGVDGIGEAGSERPVDLQLDLAEQNPLRLRVQDRHDVVDRRARAVEAQQQRDRRQDASDPGGFICIARYRVGPERDMVRPKRSEEHTSELQSLMRISYAGFCLKKKTSADNSR